MPARVRPWERSALADDIMNPDRDPLGTAAAEHVYFSREPHQGAVAWAGAAADATEPQALSL